MNNIDRKNMWFSYSKTPYNVRISYKNKKRWDIVIHKDDRLDLSIASTCLHYWQEIFEWLKAFRGKDNKIRIFRPEENAIRMQNSAKKIMMQAPDIDLFLNAVTKVVELNADYVPPYWFGASLYIRPLLIWTWSEIWLKPSKEYEFIVFVMPVWPYYLDWLKPIDAIVAYNFDRAAPLWVWRYKVWWNYAAWLEASQFAKNNWYNIELYLDSKEKKYIDECGTANFFAISWNEYITPKSDSILPSITNKSIRAIAQKKWMTVIDRQIEIDELSNMDEVWACGTALSIVPIAKIHNPNKNIDYVFHNCPWPKTKMLYENLIWIQFGDIEDEFGRNKII